jgi:hypothetical protein
LNSYPKKKIRKEYGMDIVNDFKIITVRLWKARIRCGETDGRSIIDAIWKIGKKIGQNIIHGL